ncbi:MAG: hypothetical protein HC820_09030 [Hydrococcus sp. RM1_1_31]|nr:hypothetical protein [Hydrococcus sp. RM1_1_31]
MTKITNIQPDMSLGHNSIKVPQSLMTSSRQEFGKNGSLKLRLEVKEGAIPSDLQGHVFIVSPVGFDDSTYGQGLAIFNGDGMIYRLDLEEEGKVYLKTEIARTPCYYADLALQKQQNASRYLLLQLGNDALLPSHGTAKLSQYRLFTHAISLGRRRSPFTDL